MAPRSAEDVGASTPLTRRALLAGSASALAAGAAAPVAAQETGSAPTQVPDYGGWFGPDAKGGATSSFTGTVDRRGRDSVTIQVGTSGNGGSYAFTPTAVWVDPGTAITFEWVSNYHNVVVESQPAGAGWSGHETLENSGFTFEHTFEAGGVYAYYCNPHLGLGMKGAIAVGDDVPLTSPGSADGGGFTIPGGDVGLSFVGVLLGTAGLAAAIVLGGEVAKSTSPDGDGPKSAYVTALGALTVGIILLAAVVVRLVGA